MFVGDKKTNIYLSTKVTLSQRQLLGRVYRDFGRDHGGLQAFSLFTPVFSYIDQDHLVTSSAESLLSVFLFRFRAHSSNTFAQMA